MSGLQSPTGAPTPTRRSPALAGIVEDHPLFRETIAAVVGAMDEIQLGPVVASAEDALEVFAAVPPDLAFVDLSLGGITGLELVTQIGRRWPAMRCIILSGHRRAEYAQQALRVGARAYILKGRTQDLRDGVRQVLAGETYVSEAVRPTP